MPRVGKVRRRHDLNIRFLDIGKWCGLLFLVGKSIYSRRAQALAALLKQMRIDAGLTQTELARKIGRHQPYVHDYEAGRRQLRVPQIDEIAHVLGTTTHKVIGELDQIAPPDEMVLPEDER